MSFTSLCRIYFRLFLLFAISGLPQKYRPGKEIVKGITDSDYKCVNFILHLDHIIVAVVLFVLISQHLLYYYHWHNGVVEDFKVVSGVVLCVPPLPNANKEEMDIIQ